MKQTFLFTLLLLAFSTFAQKNKLFNAQVQLGGGYSKHGSGDMKGIAFFTEYSKPIGKRTEWTINIMTTINGDRFKVIVNNPDGTQNDQSFRYNSSGLQAGPKFGYSLLQARHHQIKIQAGTFARYQNSTSPDMYSFYINQSSGMPQPSFEFFHNEKQNTISAGYSVDLSYNFITSKKLMIGFKAGFQNDTQGDAIPQLCVAVGRRF